MPSQPSRDLQSFPNPNPERDYEIVLDCPEFSCLCPLTGQPDFAQFTITYVPDERCVELKSLKLYLWSFRDEGHFHEKMTNRLADDFIALLDPRKLEVKATWNVRGGITTFVNVRHEKPAPSARAAKVTKTAPRRQVAAKVAKAPAKAAPVKKTAARR